MLFAEHAEANHVLARDPCLEDEQGRQVPSRYGAGLPTR